MTESKAASPLGVTFLRVVAVATSLGLGGYLVVRTQMRANPVQRGAEDPPRHLENPAALLGEDFGGSAPGASRFPTFIYSSKILQSTSIPPLHPAERGYVLPSEPSSKAVSEVGPTFLSSSKSVMIVTPLTEQPTTNVQEVNAKSESADRAKDEAAKSSKDG